MADTEPITLEPRVRFWTLDGQVLWTSATDQPDLLPEMRQALADLAAGGEWIYTTVDYVRPDGTSPPRGWATRWAGRLRLRDGYLEQAQNVDLLGPILIAPNPTYEPEAVTDGE